MKAKAWVSTGVLLAMAACASPETYRPISRSDLAGASLSAVTAKAGTLDGPVGPTGVFSTHDPICIFLTFRLKEAQEKHPRVILARYYREGLLVHSSQSRSGFSESPWNVWLNLPPNLLGVGRYRVDICSQDFVLDSLEFEVTGP